MSELHGREFYGCADTSAAPDLMVSGPFPYRNIVSPCIGISRTKWLIYRINGIIIRTDCCFISFLLFQPKIRGKWKKELLDLQLWVQKWLQRKFPRKWKQRPRERQIQIRGTKVCCFWNINKWRQWESGGSSKTWKGRTLGAGLNPAYPSSEPSTRSHNHLSCTSKTKSQMYSHELSQ